MAVPSILIEAPSGRTKDVLLFETPSLSFNTLIVVERVALELLVEKARACT